MDTLQTLSHSIEVIPTDYTLAYTALARRVAAAQAYLSTEQPFSASYEIDAAMRVIDAVENTQCLIQKNAST